MAAKGLRGCNMTYTGRRDNIIHLSRQVLYPKCVRVKPLIRQGLRISERGCVTAGVFQKQMVACLYGPMRELDGRYH